MASRHRKRFRKNDDFRIDLPSGTARSNNATANKVNCSNTIPTLVSEIFLENLRVFQLLRICRLVCKSWNIAATKSLRACSVVRLKEGSSKIADFTDVFLKRCLGSEQLPSPFKRFHVTGSSFTDPKFLKLAFVPNIEVTRLELKLGNANNQSSFLYQSQLRRIFALQKSNITHLKIVFGSSPFEMHEALSGEMELLSLKCLELNDKCKHCKHIPFVANILRICKPEQFTLDISDGDWLISLLTQQRLKYLNQFELNLYGMSAKAWEHLCQLRFFNLREMIFEAFFAMTPYDLEQWHLFCKNVSPFVKDFTTNIEFSTESELVFPNLTDITVDETTDLSGLTPDRFPSLTYVYYNFDETLIRAPPRVAFPHEGVRTLMVGIMEDVMANADYDEDLLCSLVYLRRQFPNVSSLAFYVKEFRDFTIADICEAFPNITAIELEGKCNFFSFSGMRDSIVSKYLEMGQPVESIPRRKSISDLVGLRSITFGSEFIVVPEMITHCVSKIPKLRKVTLHWNTSLSAPLLRDSLGHVKKLVIL